MGRYAACPENCGGEDCICCELHIEEMADRRADAERDPRDMEDDYPYDEDDYSDDNWDDEEAEDDERDIPDDPTPYERIEERDTPLGELYGNGFDNEG